MSFVTTTPEIVTTAATDLESIGSTLSAAHAAAAGPTSGVLAAAEDEVSAAIASLFSTYGKTYQSLSAQAAAFQADFVQAVKTAALSYAAAEAANTSPLQGVLNAVNAPVQALLGQAGGAGGLSGLAGSGSIAGELGLLGALGTGGTLGSLITPGPLGGLGGLGTPGAFGALAPLAAAAEQANYAQLIQNTVTNLQSLLGVPRLPFLQQVILNQIGYGSLITQSFGNAASHLLAAFQALPDFGTAAAQLVASLASLTPILSIPGSILQNITNLYNAITNFSVTLSTGPVMLTFGLPLALLLDGLGSLITAGQAFGVSSNLLFAPSTILNGFLNGAGALTVGATAPGGASLSVSLPAFGLLNSEQGHFSGSLQLPPIEIPNPIPGRPPTVVPVPPIDVTIPGTPITGLVPALVFLAPQELAHAIGGPPPVVP